MRYHREKTKGHLKFREAIGGDRRELRYLRIGRESV